MTQSSPTTPTAPAQTDVDAVRGLLDLLADFPDNDQRARYLLTSDWMRERLAPRQSDEELMDALTSRLTGAPANTANVTTVNISTCPEWCTGHESPEHSRDAWKTTDGRWVVDHPGPSWGAFGAGGMVDLRTGATTLSIDVDSVVIERTHGTSDPAVLRKLSVDALAAAEWLEANA